MSSRDDQGVAPPVRAATVPEGPGAARAVPPLPLRLLGQALSLVVARVPGAWPLLRRPTRAYWERMASKWDSRVEPDSPHHLAPLAAACDLLERPPRRILELGTGTGAGALMLAGRFPGAEVVAVDISQAMIDRARAKATNESAERLRFVVGDAASLPYQSGMFDLIAQLNMPVYFDEMTRLVSPGGYLIVASSLGPATPYYTPERVLRRGFVRRGLEPSATGREGIGSYYLASAPGFTHELQTMTLRH